MLVRYIHRFIFFLLFIAFLLQASRLHGRLSLFPIFPFRRYFLHFRQSFAVCLEFNYIPLFDFIPNTRREASFFVSRSAIVAVTKRVPLNENSLSFSVNSRLILTRLQHTAATCSVDYESVASIQLHLSLILSLIHRLTRFRTNNNIELRVPFLRKRFTILA